MPKVSTGAKQFRDIAAAEEAIPRLREALQAAELELKVIRESRIREAARIIPELRGRPLDDSVLAEVEQRYREWLVARDARRDRRLTAASAAETARPMAPEPVPEPSTMFDD